MNPVSREASTDIAESENEIGEPAVTNDGIIEIKQEHFEKFKHSRQVWLIEERGAEFIVHQWHGEGWQNGAGVAPATSYPTLRKATARLLQLLGIGPVAPQTWPEDICVGSVEISGDVDAAS
jgi:hypothetical protein